MKYYIKNFIYILFLFSFLFIGCNESFLDRNPTDRPTSESFWRNEQDAYMALMGVYSRLYLEPFATRFRIEVLSDNARSFEDLEQEYNQITEGTIYPTMGGPVSTWYANMHRGVTSCNFFLDNIDKIEDIDLEIKNQYAAEVRFLRAWFYFQLQQTYGGVIIYESIPGVEESKIKQSSSDDVTSFILQDVDAAIQNLPNSKYAGRIVKNTAYAFKAKVLLFNGQWTEAAAEAKKVIDSGLSTLYPNYRNLFLSEAQEGNPDEILFSTVYALPERYHRGGNDHVEYGTTSPRNELLDSYLCIDGLPTSESPLFDPETPYLNRDPRCLQTINPTNLRVVNGDTVIYTVGATGIMWNKFVEDYYSYFDRNAELDDYDIIHLRYADVLLMYAEAQNEAAGPDQSVYAAINEVRARSNMPPVEPGLSVDEMRNTIRLERRIELAGEGHRWFDIKRWGIANEVLQQVDEPGRGTGILKMEPYQYLWPLPQS
ncbi:RagB/SusD family nutrient uptake outer membrane protein, partial [Mariniphaga sediminis]|uniref:RagB/SusD family nutrient uptake outer membrane protein n=1 Tax=Mariniphaga sediminis TaxID=1628158 RepID=UPI00356AC1BB